MVSAKPGRFTPNKRPNTHCVGSWLGTSARVGPVQKILPLPGFDPLTVRLVASRYNSQGSIPLILEFIVFSQSIDFYMLSMPRPQQI